MADSRSISKEYKEYEEQREKRIMRRVKAYISGEFSLEDFYGLEKLDLDDDRFNGFKETAAKLADLDAAEKDTSEEETIAKSPRKNERPATIPPELKYMTAEEYRALSLAEQSRLYAAAPERVREILDDTPEYMKLIRPKEEKRSYKGTTLEQFKKLKISELQELYNEDPALYDSLQAEREAEGMK